MKIKTIIHYSDLHLKLYKQHTRDKNILEVALKEWEELSPDRIVFTGDSRVNKFNVLVYDRNSKNM